MSNAQLHNGPSVDRISFAHMLRTALIVWGVGTATAWLLGPLGTFTAMSDLERLGYWAALVGIGTLLGLGARYLTSMRLDLRTPRGIFATATLQSVIIGPVLYWTNTEIFQVTDPALRSVGFHILIAANVCFVIALVRWWALVSWRPEGEVVPVEVEASEVQNLGPVFSRAVSDIGTEILHASADGHYTHLLSAQGSTRVLMRFSDVMEELSRLDGMRVHRSHWVARQAIDRVVQEGQKTFVVMRCGRRIPVSRTYQRALPELRVGT